MLICPILSQEEFKTASNPQSKNIPLDCLEKEIKNLDKSRPIIVCCASGMRSSIAAKILKKAGFIEITNAGAWTKTL